MSVNNRLFDLSLTDKWMDGWMDGLNNDYFSPLHSS